MTYRASSGYTGINDRLEQKSGGLGLYLAKKAADLLSIREQSVPGKGERVYAGFEAERIMEWNI